MITVTKNNEGYWLNFKSSKGKKMASIRVEIILNSKRGIIEQAIIETCEEDCIADYSDKKAGE